MKNNQFTFLEILIIVIVMIVFFSVALPSVTDIKNSSKASQLQKDLTELRGALEKYYEITGEYPPLKGVEDILDDVSAKNSKGEKVLFSEVYGRRRMPSTPDIGDIKKRNSVNHMRKFTETTDRGGWNYNYEDQTGEIHANLPEGIFNQSIEWRKQ